MMDAATQGEEATAKNNFCLEAGYLHATLRLIDRTDFRCVSGSVRGVWAGGGSLSHTSDRRAIGEAGILHRYRPLDRISARRLRPNTLDPSPRRSRRIGYGAEPL